jgi:hypothetical protein
MCEHEKAMRKRGEALAHAERLREAEAKAERLRKEEEKQQGKSKECPPGYHRCVGAPGSAIRPGTTCDVCTENRIQVNFIDYNHIKFYTVKDIGIYLGRDKKSKACGGGGAAASRAGGGTGVGSSAAPAKVFCKNWQASGSCPFGERCRYKDGHRKPKTIAEILKNL